jgi:hypothetical protein
MADAAPTTAKQAFEIMPSRFNKDAAKGLNAIYQFDLSGDGGGKWQVIAGDMGLALRMQSLFQQ